MAKQTFYFPHDGNARNDDRIIAVRMRHKMEGYGVYFAILERLLESSEYMSVKDYNVIAFDLHVGSDLIKSIVEDFGLFSFTDDGKYFFSNSFNDRMKPLENIREQRRLAGKKSAEKRAKNNDSSTTVERPLPKKATEESRVYKEKEIIKEKVILLNGEEKSISERLIPFLTEMLSDTISIERLCMNNHLKPDMLKDFIKQFFVLRSNENNQEIQVINDAQSYFSRWLSCELEKENKHKPNEKPQKTGTAAGFKQFR